MAAPHLEQLDKILALADSGHDSEAISAVRKARQLMSRDGISFGDLARAAMTRAGAGLLRKRGEVDAAYWQRRIAELEDQLRAQDLQVGFWRMLAGDLQRRLDDNTRAGQSGRTLPPLPPRFIQGDR